MVPPTGIFTAILRRDRYLLLYQLYHSTGCPKATLSYTTSLAHTVTLSCHHIESRMQSFYTVSLGLFEQTSFEQLPVEQSPIVQSPIEQLTVEQLPVEQYAAACSLHTLYLLLFGQYVVGMQSSLTVSLGLLNSMSFIATHDSICRCSSNNTSVLLAVVYCLIIVYTHAIYSVIYHRIFTASSFLVACWIPL